MSDYIETNEAGELVNYTQSPYVNGMGAYVWDNGAQPITAVVNMAGETHYMTPNGVYKAP